MGPTSFVELLRGKVLRLPDDRVYTFLGDGETEAGHLTCAELDRQARAIGAVLQQHSAQGERAMLLYPAGLEFVAAFFGCLYAGVIAVPAAPPPPWRLERALPKLRAVAGDAQPLFVLTTSQLISMADPVRAQAAEFRAMRWLATDRIADDPAEAWRDPAVGGDALALLQYTSGSTATPKGVMVSHRNLLHNTQVMRNATEIPEGAIVVSWLPHFHDMGLIGKILCSLAAGTRCILMSPVSFLQRPFRWLMAISRYQAMASGAPNFAYELCLRKVTPEQRAALNLASWKIAFNGAEPVRGGTLSRFTAAFASCGFRPEAFYPCYGLAEASLMVAGGDPTTAPVVRTFQAAGLERRQVITTPEGGEDTRTLVGCGHTLPDHEIVIADPVSGARCPAGQVGEIWVSGPSVAQGYWNRPGETRRTFQAHLAERGEGPFLRTGDLGFLFGGDLFITGRLKDLIIVDGRNHAPQDIEMTVEQSHPALGAGACAAFSVDLAGEERLVIVAEIDRLHAGRQRTGQDQAPWQALDARAVVQAIRRAVAEQHDLRVHDIVLLKAGTLPRTSSGKIQRHECRAGFLANTLDALAS